MSKNEIIALLRAYIDRTKEIQNLSSPRIDKARSAEEYRLHLQDSFIRIGELAQLNNDMLDNYFYPLLEKEEMTDVDMDALFEFSNMLIDTINMENVDLPLIYLIAKGILEKVENGDDERRKIIALDNMIIAAYMMMILTERMAPDFKMSFEYRDEGLRAGYKLLEYLEPEKFRALPDDECREMVLINSRYMRCLFMWKDKEDIEFYNAEDFRILEHSLSLMDDPFYREIMPDYDWELHKLRILHYFADFTEYMNEKHYSKEQLEKKYEYTVELVRMIEDRPQYLEFCPEKEQNFYMLRNSYLAGKISLSDYKHGLREAMKGRDVTDYSTREIFFHFTAPNEFVAVLDKDNLSKEDEDTLRMVYDDLAGYIYRLPKNGVISFMVTFLTNLLSNYIEVPGAISFQDMCARLTAAMHPPTYVHMLTVSDITKFLSEKLMEKEPELFTGIMGCKDALDVMEKREELLSFIAAAAQTHDVGKLFVIERIMTYGRSLKMPEIRMIQAHSVIGASLLERHEETREYAEMARGHHVWYDGSAGYPSGIDHSKEKYHVITSIVEVADCLDAATDSIGRSYKSGKSIDEFMEELREGKGTRYAPYVVDILEDVYVRMELRALLIKCRSENYRRTYEILKMNELRKSASDVNAENKTGHSSKGWTPGRKIQKLKRMKKVYST